MYNENISSSKVAPKVTIRCMEMFGRNLDNKGKRAFLMIYSQKSSDDYYAPNDAETI